MAWAALMLASQKGHEPAVKALLGKGASMDHVSPGPLCPRPIRARHACSVSVVSPALPRPVSRE